MGKSTSRSKKAGKDVLTTANNTGIVMSQSSRKRPPAPPSAPPGGGRPAAGLGGAPRERRSGSKRVRRDGASSDGADECDEGPTTLDDLTDAASYLAWVKRQASSLPDVFVAPADGGDVGPPDVRTDRGEGDDGGPVFGSAATLAVLLSDRMAVLPPPTRDHAPPSGWVRDTVSNFSALRTYLEERSAALKRGGRGGTSPAGGGRRRVAVPRMKDRAGWHRFCLGRDEAHGNPGGRFEVDDSEDGGEDDNGGGGPGGGGDGRGGVDLPEDGAATAPRYDPASVPPGGHPPTTSLLLQLDQVLTRRLLHHHVHWVVESGRVLTPSRAGWVYALLARMERPWHRDECAAVRGLVRECCARRAGIRDDREGLAMLNLLIAVGGVYGEQGAACGGDCRDALFAVREGGAAMGS